MFSSSLNYEENFSRDCQYNPLDEDPEMEVLFEIERGEMIPTGYED